MGAPSPSLVGGGDCAGEGTADWGRLLIRAPPPSMPAPQGAPRPNDSEAVEMGEMGNTTTIFGSHGHGRLVGAQDAAVILIFTVQVDVCA